MSDIVRLGTHSMTSSRSTELQFHPLSDEHKIDVTILPFFIGHAINFDISSPGYVHPRFCKVQTTALVFPQAIDHRKSRSQHRAA